MSSVDGETVDGATVEGDSMSREDDDDILEALIGTATFVPSLSSTITVVGLLSLISSS